MISGPLAALMGDGRAGGSLAFQRARTEPGGAGKLWHVAGAVQQFFTSTALVTLDTLIAVPYLDAAPGRLDRLGACISSASGTPGTTLRLGIYAAHPVTLYPGALLGAAGPFDSNVASTPVSGAVDVPVEPFRLYWLALLAGGAANSRVYAFSSTGPGFPLLLGYAADLRSPWGSLSIPYSGAGALPDPFPGAAGMNSFLPCLFARYA